MMANNVGTSLEAINASNPCIHPRWPSPTVELFTWSCDQSPLATHAHQCRPPSCARFLQSQGSRYRHCYLPAMVLAVFKATFAPEITKIDCVKRMA